ncbi:DUF3300 domain-containing protein [Breoghania sp.]|uniref:DUF3300 domain-containing protein n=1 Tax=Breoghania sp. TaxID=2065378 RepID=UPI002AA77E28|nr:DUF3300 domain-containing protein [Breoghania sp.]
MRHWTIFDVSIRTSLILCTGIVLSVTQADAQQQPAEPTAVAAAEAPAAAGDEPLSEDELEILVARIALYPDELVALVSAASLYPLQIVEASRFLDEHEKNADRQPKADWDGSVVSLLNYPQIVKMMSDDLDWTQALGDALAVQQQDVLVAIQQLRAQAQSAGIISSDDKVKVTEENDNIVIQSAQPDVVYVPQYEPAMLYEPDYPPAPIGYYPDPFPQYFLPGATFFTGAVTGAIFAAAVDWDDWGVWGGRWDGGGIDINCNHCMNNVDINGKINFNDVDWKNIDRDKIKIDRDQFTKIDRDKIKNNIKANSDNSIRNRVSSLNKQRPTTLPGHVGSGKDVRRKTLEGLKAKPGQVSRPKPTKATRPTAKLPAARKPTKAAKPNVVRKPGNARPAAKIDKRPKKPSGLGRVQPKKRANLQSSRGHKSMGGGHKGGAKPHRTVKRGGGGHKRR